MEKVKTDGEKERKKEYQKGTEVLISFLGNI